LDLKRPDEVELLREALNDLSDLPDGMISQLSELAGKRDDERRPAEIRKLLEDLSRE
jgi:hypothetical protein